MLSKILVALGILLCWLSSFGCGESSEKLNASPLLSTIGQITIAANSTKQIELSASDPDLNQTLSFCKKDSPAWITVTGQGQTPGLVFGQLTLSPGTSDVGQHLITVQVIDEGSCESPTGDSDEETTAVTVE